MTVLIIDITLFSNYYFTCLYYISYNILKVFINLKTKIVNSTLSVHRTICIHIRFKIINLTLILL